MRAELVVSLAGLSFACARLTLCHDRNEGRRRVAVRHALTAVDGLIQVVRELRQPQLTAATIALARRDEACPNGPDLETGEWPCERGPDDTCLTCGWAPEPSA